MDWCCSNIPVNNGETDINNVVSSSLRASCPLTSPPSFTQCAAIFSSGSPFSGRTSRRRSRMGAVPLLLLYSDVDTSVWGSPPPGEKAGAVVVVQGAQPMVVASVAVPAGARAAMDVAAAPAPPEP